MILEFKIYGLLCRVRKIGHNMSFNKNWYFRIDVYNQEKPLGEYRASAKTPKEAVELAFECFDSLRSYKNNWKGQEI